MNYIIYKSIFFVKFLIIIYFITYKITKPYNPIDLLINLDNKLKNIKQNLTIMIVRIKKILIEKKSVMKFLFYQFVFALTTQRNMLKRQY